jgi:hypothetical protein
MRLHGLRPGAKKVFISEIQKSLGWLEIIPLPEIGSLRAQCKLPFNYGGAVMAAKKAVGEITHYFDHINVAVVKLSNTLKVGDKILVKAQAPILSRTWIPCRLSTSL